MATLQVSRLAADLAAPTLQVSRLEGSVPVPAGAMLQVARLAVDITAVAAIPVVTGQAAITVDPFETVTMTVSTSGVVDSVSWTQQPGSGLPTIPLAGTDLSKSFDAPAQATQSTVKWAVNATGPGGTSNPVIITVTIRPQVAWYLNSALQWVPDRSLAPNL